MQAKDPNSWGWSQKGQIKDMPMNFVHLQSKPMDWFLYDHVIS